MNILITSARFPHSVSFIRQFGQLGHKIFACDTFKSSPGLKSRYTYKSFKVPSPTLKPLQFIQAINDIIEKHDIEMLVPCFEEILYFSKYKTLLHARVRDSIMDFKTLNTFHDKYLFHLFCKEHDLLTPATTLVNNQQELADELQKFQYYCARPVYSRGGTEILCNLGPLSRKLTLEQCNPTVAAPYIVQQFINGETICSFNIAHQGKLIGHCLYRNLLTIENAGGISYVSIFNQQVLEIIQKIVRVSNFSGMISFDFIVQDEEIYLIECNPRISIGITLFHNQELYDSMINHQQFIVPVGRRKHIFIGILRNLFHDLKNYKVLLKHLLSRTPDVYFTLKDMKPLLYVVISYLRVIKFKFNMQSSDRQDLIRAQFFDISWNNQTVENIEEN